MTFMYVLMRAFEVEYTAACDASRWHEFHGGPRAVSDADLEKLLAPWLRDSHRSSLRHIDVIADC